MPYILQGDRFSFGHTFSDGSIGCRSRAFADLRRSYGASQVGAYLVPQKTSHSFTQSDKTDNTCVGDGDFPESSQIPTFPFIPVQVGVDGTASGWLTNDGSGLASFLPTSSAPGSIDWRAGNFEEGDLIVLHQDLLHMTACNTADSFRISCDTRWQPCAEPANPTLGSWRQIE